MLNQIYEAEAERFPPELKARLKAFARSLHPDRTRLIAFGCFAASNREKPGLGKPETFMFLGFTQLWAKTRKTVCFVTHSIPEPGGGGSGGAADTTA